jgi:predicted dehydrogenase
VSVSRILIVGLGSIGSRHLRLARELLPNADIGVMRHQECVSIPEQANACFSSLSKAIDFAPEIAIIASPATFHLSAAQGLAMAGVDMLIEKPLAASSDGAIHLIDTCRARGSVLLVGYNLRYLPSLRRFRDLIHEGSIGTVVSVRCEIGQYLPSWRPEADYRQGVSAKRELGGGALLELSHELDYLRWIFGDIDWVQAYVGRQSSLEIDVEDTAHLILGFASGADGGRLVGTVNMDFVRHDATRFCAAIGETGTLRWNGITGAVEFLGADTKDWREVYRHRHQRDDSYRAEWLHFLDCAERRATPLVTGADGLAVLRVIDAARLASESGGRVGVVKPESSGGVGK